MADSYHIIDGEVVPYSGGRICNNTDAWRDATPLELQLQEQLDEYEHIIDAQTAEIEKLQGEVDALCEALAGLITWIPSADTYRRLGFDPAAPMRSLERARAALGREGE